MKVAGEWMNGEPNYFVWGEKMSETWTRWCVVRAHDRQIVARYARLTSAERACKRRNKLALKSAD